MTVHVTRTFMLTGPLEGKTTALRNYSFVNGEMSVSLPDGEMEKLSHYLTVNWHVSWKGKDGGVQIHKDGPDGSVQKVQRTESGASDSEAADSQGNDDAEAVPEGGQAESDDGQGADSEVDEKLRRAVLALDPENDAHWTAGGKPLIDAVVQFYGSEGVTRKQIEAVLPEFIREKAKG